MAAWLTPERQDLRAQAERFVREEVRPLADALDPKQGLIPRTLIEKMGRLGYFGILIPQAEGGLGLGAAEYCLIAEEMARGWMSVASLLARGNGFYKFVPAGGSGRAEKIRLMAQGEYLGAYAISEPQAGSDVAQIACRAKADGENWRLSGNKYWCTFADGADFIHVITRTRAGEEKKRHLGLTAFSLEKPRGGLPQGVSGSPIPKIGYFGWKTWELRFDDVLAPKDALIGEPERAFYALAREFEIMRVHTAARAIGSAQAALDEAQAYAQERRQFGQPIAQFQAIRFKLADMASAIAAARALMYDACAAIDNADDGADDDSNEGQSGGKVLAAMAKYHASEMAERVTSEALQILGGAGYTTLHSVERYWRDARLTKIFEGSSEIMKKIISDDMLGR